MSTAAISLLYRNVERSTTAPAPLRILLLPGEVLALPRGPSPVHVLSGTAWVTQGGRDFVLERGQRMEHVRGRDRPVVSGLGTEALLFELP
jgi:hypothetical protein